MQAIDPLTGEILRKIARYTVYPKTHYVTPRETILGAVEQIREELKGRLAQLEAANWELDRYFFPDPQPANLRILVSARSKSDQEDDRDWRRQLGWQNTVQAWSIQLSRLSPDGIAEVLETMSSPLAALAGKKELLQALFRLSDGGDPLLVHLFIERLKEKGEAAGWLTQTELDALEPGIVQRLERRPPGQIDDRQVPVFGDLQHPGSVDGDVTHGIFDRPRRVDLPRAASPASGPRQHEGPR